MRQNRIITGLWIVYLTLQLGGCGQSEALDELDKYLANMKNQPAGPIDPLPDLKSYDNFIYTASNVRSPFARPDSERNLKSNGLRPDRDRKKEVLESYPLDSLRMLGTLERKGKRWAIIKDSDATIHRISVGNYMGQNDGRVDSITEDNVKITEIIPDGRGGWIERKSSLALISE